MNLNETATNAAEYSVSELSHSLKRTIEDSYGYVRLRGEVSGYRGPHSSGHAYFCLKDAGAKIDAVIWRGNFGKLKFKPEEGLEVIATGKVTTYPGSSKYQIVIERMEPSGAGALMALLEERRRKFAAEGLFDASRKKILPRLPLTIGIITSPTGAVIRDMLHRIADRFPVHVVVWPVRVQGETSAEEVALAIEGFNLGRVHHPKPDVLIVARGGGSFEDLWSFNEERVVRAAALSLIPLISAIGHETDWTLLDHVADLRAPTPTAAAELALLVRKELLTQLVETGARKLRAVLNLHSRMKQILDAKRRALPRLETLLGMPRQRFDHAAEKLPRAAFASFQQRRLRLNRDAQRLSLPLVQQRLARMREKLDGLGQRSARAVMVEPRRREFAKTAQRLAPAAFRQRAVKMRQRLDDLRNRGTRAVLVEQRRREFASTMKRLSLPQFSERIVLMRQRLHNLQDRSTRGFGNEQKRQRRSLDAKTQLLNSLSYRSVLSRGFAVVRQDEHIIMRGSDLDKKAALTLEFADGTVPLDVAHVSAQPDLFKKVN